MRYITELIQEANADLRFLQTAINREVIKAIAVQLTYQPLLQTTNRKPLRLVNGQASTFWEIRVKNTRVFYTVDQVQLIVYVIAIGSKQREMVKLEGKLVAPHALVEWLTENRWA